MHGQNHIKFITLHISINHSKRNGVHHLKTWSVFTVILCLTPFRPYVVCPQTKPHIKPSAQIRTYDAEDVFESLKSHDPTPSLEHVVGTGKEHSGPWRSWGTWIWAWAGDHDGCGKDWDAWRRWKCLRTFTQSSNVLPVIRFWRRTGFCLSPRTPYLTSRHLQALVHRHWYCWTVQMILLTAYSWRGSASSLDCHLSGFISVTHS